MIGAATAAKGLGVAAVLLGAALVYQTIVVAQERTATAVAISAKDRLITGYATAALTAQTRNLHLEGELVTLTKEKDDALIEEKGASGRVIAGLRSERDRMRDTLAAYAAGSGLSAPDTVAAASGRAAALGRSLEDALRAEEDLTAELEDQRSDTRRLLDALRDTKRIFDAAGAR